MKNKFIKCVALLFVLAFALSSVSCGSQDAEVPEGMKRIESTDKLRFDFFIPETWVQDLSTGVVSAYYGLKDMSNVSISTFSVDDYEKTLGTYVDEYIDGLKTTFSDFGLTEDGIRDTLLGKTAAKKFEYTAKLTENEYKFMQVITVYSGYMFIFTYTSQAAAYDSHIEDVQLMLDNFSFN